MYGLIEPKASGCVCTVSSLQIIKIADAIIKMSIKRNIVVRFRFINRALVNELTVSYPLVAIVESVNDSFGVVSYAAT